MSISIYVYVDRPVEEVRARILDVVSRHPEDYERDFVVSTVETADERMLRTTSEHEFDAHSYFIVDLNRKARHGLDLKTAVKRLVDSLRESNVLVLFENESVYDVGDGEASREETRDIRK